MDLYWQVFLSFSVDVIGLVYSYLFHILVPGESWNISGIQLIFNA